MLPATLARLARQGDVEALREYLRSDRFLLAFNGLDPNRRQTAIRSYAKADALCEAKARHPLIQSRPIDAKRAHKVSWGDPQMRARLAEAYSHAEGHDELAARILGVSPGSARLAKRRYLEATAADRCRTARNGL